MQKTILKTIVLSSILFMGFLSQGQDALLQKDIALPLATTVDSLPNGLKFFIKKNTIPSNKLEVRLCLRIGSSQEGMNEEGIAHFLEHMAFEGSKNYPNNEALSFWESLGAKFGININAYTGFDRTVYIISIPADSEGKNLEKTLLFLKDWLADLNLSKNSIEKQKKIVFEEIASTSEPLDIFNDAKKGNCPQLKGLPIGTKDEVLKITQKKLKKFYQKWYTPQNAAIIVVGDVNIKKTRTTIIESFGSLKARGIKNKSNSEIPYGTKPLFFSKKDTLNSETKISWIYPYCYNNTQSFQDLLEEKKAQFAIRLVKNRLSNKSLNIYRYWYLQKTSLLEFSLSEKDSINKKFSDGIAVIEGVRKYGITKAEIDYLLPSFIDNISTTTFNRDANDWADSFVEMFLFKERQLATEQDKELLIKQLKVINLQEWNAKIRSIFAFDRPEIITYKYNPNKHKKLEHKDILTLFEYGQENPDTAILATDYTEEKEINIPNILTADIPFNDGLITKNKFYPDLGIHYIELTNGAKMFLKPVKDDNRLNLSIMFKGGLSLLPRNKAMQMEDLISYIDLGGIKDIPYEKFSAILLQENFTFIRTNENYFHGVMAASPVSSSKILCNLVTQKLLNPELCYSDFNEIKNDEIKDFKKDKNKTLNKIRLYNNRLEEIRGNTIPLCKKVKTINDIEQSNLDSLYAFYKNNYLNPNNAIVIATGNFNVDSLKQYLAGSISKLPIQEKTKLNKDSDKFKFPYKFTEENMAGEEAGRAYFNLVYYGYFNNSLRNQITLKIMKDALRSRLLSELREKKGFIYSPYINLQLKAYPSTAFFFTINGSISSNNCRAVENTVNTIIETLQSNVISAEELEKIKRSFLSAKKDYLEDDRSANWRDYLQESFRTGININEINSYENILSSITMDDILSGFKSLVKKEQKVYLILGDCTTVKEK